MGRPRLTPEQRAASLERRREKMRVRMREQYLEKHPDAVQREAGRKPTAAQYGAFDHKNALPDSEIPAVAMGRAKKVTCSNGHTYIFTRPSDGEFPTRCPTRGCNVELPADIIGDLKP